MKSIKYSALFALTALLAACGGGGDGGNDTPNTPSTSSSSSSSSSSGGTSSSSSSSSSSGGSAYSCTDNGYKEIKANLGSSISTPSYTSNFNGGTITIGPLPVPSNSTLAFCVGHATDVAGAEPGNTWEMRINGNLGDVTTHKISFVFNYATNHDATWAAQPHVWFQPANGSAAQQLDLAQSAQLDTDGTATVVGSVKQTVTFNSAGYYFIK